MPGWLLGVLSRFSCVQRGTSCCSEGLGLKRAPWGCRGYFRGHSSRNLRVLGSTLVADGVRVRVHCVLADVLYMWPLQYYRYSGVLRGYSGGTLGVLGVLPCRDRVLLAVFHVRVLPPLLLADVALARYVQCACVCVRACVRACWCVCVSVRLLARYVTAQCVRACVRVGVCVCVRASSCSVCDGPVPSCPLGANAVLITSVLRRLMAA